MKQRIECWRCGAAVKSDQLPITRLEQCLHCHADLHACRLCRSWNPRYTSKCSHDHAEPPLDRERANFCQYFRPAPGAFRNAAAPASETARTDLEALFGNSQEHTETGADTAADNKSETERARRALDDLFGGNKENDTPGST
jgi:hypothetical protein